LKSPPFSHRPASVRCVGRLLALGWIASALTLAHADAPDAAPASAPGFEQDILPILTQHCLKCHGLEARKSGLDLRSVALMRKGGDGGAVLEAGSLDNSSLYGRIADRSMPPEGELPLTDAKIETIRRWIEAGAAAAEPDAPVAESEVAEVSQQDREYWAFVPPVRRDPPAVQHADQVRTPIDAFLLDKLEAVGLAFSPPADRRAIARRAYLDLIGLPPSPEELAAFLADTGDDAYERLIDRLLDSPHFGERWGRHWLDAAGYVDTVGADNDATIIRIADGKWKYRDYVVRAFNSDKPYDRFLAEQLAGDELVDWRNAANFTPETLDLLIATGYLRNVADRTAEDELNTADIRISVLFDTNELVGTNLLGLTTQCARCHTHKYDPIPHRDYYRLMALFTPAFNVQAWLQPEYREGTIKKAAYRELPDIAPVEQAAIDAHNASVKQQVEALNAELAALRGGYQARLFDAKLATLPEALRADVKTAVETAADQRNEVQKYLAEKLGPSVAVSAEEVTAALSADDRARADAIPAEVARLNGTVQSYGKVQAVWDVGPPPDTFVFRRGDHLTPGDQVQPGFLAVLSNPNQPLAIGDSSSGMASSGRRLALARWLTDPAQPASGLVSRVMVNRIWAHLFGQGIVATTGNFGQSGTPPTHPELLDWLATEFVAGDWRVKPMIRQMMLSTAYRQASHRGGGDDPRAVAAQAGSLTAGNIAAEGTANDGTPSPQADPLTVDPGNELLWRMRLRRMESEVVRDAILATSGALDRTMGGPPLPLDPRPDGTVVLKADGLPTPTSQWRRSLYILARRAYHLSMLDVFDQPQVATNCTDRTPSAVVSQSLAMLNDAFVLEQADLFAGRVAAAGATSDERIAAAFEIALSRPPDEAERTWSSELLARQAERFRAAGEPADRADQRALASLCQMLLNSNEFLYRP
jgi:hypothetical protein